MFVIGLRMMTLQVVLLVLILILDGAVQAIVKKFLSLLITIGSILIIILLPYPFDLEAGIPLPLLLIGIIHRTRRTTTTTIIAFPLVLEFHVPILTH